MEKKELLGKIEKLIKEQKLPAEIKDIVNEIYLDYYDSYKRFVSNAQIGIDNDAKAQIELANIVDYINRQYEEMKSIFDEMEKTSYLIKLDIMSENVKNVMNNMFRSRILSDNNLSLSPIIDTEELTEEQKSRKQKRENDETIKSSVNIDSENRKCAQEIVATVKSEIENLKDALIVKLANIKVNRDYIEHSKREFLNEVELIKSKATLKLIPGIKEILDAQDVEISNYIIDIYDQYTQEKKTLTDREKFVSDIHVEVDTEGAIKKVQGESEIKLEEKNEQALLGNEIE